MNQMFLELTGILIAAAVLAYVLHFLKQPSIIAYIITGLMIGPFAIYNFQHTDILHGLSEVGITLLLFMIGLDLDVSQLKRIGKTAVFAGIGQVIFTTLAGFVLVTMLGFSFMSAIYISLALTFSSTIIVVKLLSEKKDMQSLYGKLAVGIFLVQDIAAIFILILISSLTSSGEANLAGGGPIANIIVALGKAFIIGMIVAAISRTIFPKLLKSLVKSDELTLLFSLAWALGLGALFSSPIIGFNAAIGGFIAGLALANTGAHYQISGRVKPLRDFFIIIFFIVLGSQLVFSHIHDAIWPALILTGFVLIGNPLIVTIILGVQGYKLRTSFMAGVTVAQVSEFSLILMSLGLAAGHVSETDVTVVTLVGIITISMSSYGILYSSKLYEKLISHLAVFFEGRNNGSREKSLGDVILKRHIVIVGAHRLGEHIAHTLLKQKEQIVVVDFNPDVVSHFSEHGILAILGDISDPYIQEVARLSDARMVICSIPDYSDTLALLEAIHHNLHKRPKVIVAASDESEALQLYEKGAGYVLLPHFVGSQHLAHVVEQSVENRGLSKLREKHLKALRRALEVV